MSKQLAEMESLFKALADVTRLRILGLLLAGEVCVCDIHEPKIPVEGFASSGLPATVGPGRDEAGWPVDPLSLGDVRRSRDGGDRRCRPPRVDAPRHRAS
jgi:DNA-binding transcriptional ArsR family regulator